MVSNRLSRALISFIAHSLARTFIRLREEILLVKSWIIFSWLLFEQSSLKLLGLLVKVLRNLAKEIMGLHYGVTLYKSSGGLTINVSNVLLYITIYYVYFQNVWEY